MKVFTPRSSSKHQQSIREENKWSCDATESSRTRNNQTRTDSKVIDSRLIYQRKQNTIGGQQNTNNNNNNSTHETNFSKSKHMH